MEAEDPFPCAACPVFLSLPAFRYQDAIDLDPRLGENLVLHVVRLDGDGLRSLRVAGEAPAWSGGGSAPQAAPGTYRVTLPLVVR